MANNKRKKTKEEYKPETVMKLHGKDLKLVKACFEGAYEMDQETTAVNGAKRRGRKPHWTRKNLISEMNSQCGVLLSDKYSEQLKRELRRIIDAGQSAIYLDQAKMINKYGKNYSSIFDVSRSGSYVTYFLGITDTQYCNVKAH